MMPVPVAIAGPSELNRSSQLSKQYAQNIYLGTGRQGEHKWVAYDFPGLKPFYAGAGADRGMAVYLGEIYKVSGNSLISINSSGAATTRGTVPGSGRCIMYPIRDDSVGIGLIIATDGIRYYYNRSSVSVISDADLTTGNSVAVLNNVAVYDCLNDVLVHSTAGAPTDVSAFYAEANTFTDDLQRIYAFNGLIYAYGELSGEVWAYNGATTEFIFTRQEQATFTVGLGAIHSLASDEIYMFFLGHDRRFYRLRGSLPESSITTAGIANELAKMGTVSDCVAWIVKFAEQSFYWATFPTEGKTFVYSITYNYWVNLAYGTDSDNPARHLAGSHAYCYGKNYVADYRNGNVYELDLSTFDDAGDARLRVIVMAPLTGAQIGLPGRRVTVGSLQLDMQVGVGLASGQGVNPLLMMSASDDGGMVYGAESHIEIGALGDYTANPKFDYFANGRSVVHRIMCSDPVYLSIFGGVAEAEDGGD